MKLKNNKRITKQQTILTDTPDNDKIRIASKANYIQSMDASLVRWVLKKDLIISIHDCFLIDYLSINYFIARINEGMRIIYHDLNIEENIKTEKMYSIFIIL